MNENGFVTFAFKYIEGVFTCSKQTGTKYFNLTEMHFLLQKNLRNIMHGRVKMYVMR